MGHMWSGADLDMEILGNECVDNGEAILGFALHVRLMR
jgi:hypothetical protein